MVWRVVSLRKHLPTYTAEWLDGALGACTTHGQSDCPSWPITLSEVSLTYVVAYELQRIEKSVEQ